MTTLTKIDRVAARELANRAEELLKPLESEYNVTIRCTGGSYDPAGIYTPRFEFTLVTDEGAVSREVIDFPRYASAFGLNETDLGRTFTTRLGTYRIAGIRPRSTKYPILAVDVKSERTFKFGSETVVKALASSAAD